MSGRNSCVVKLCDVYIRKGGMYARSHAFLLNARQVTPYSVAWFIPLNATFWLSGVRTGVLGDAAELRGVIYLHDFSASMASTCSSRASNHYQYSSTCQFFENRPTYGNGFQQYKGARPYRNGLSCAVSSESTEDVVSPLIWNTGLHASAQVLDMRTGSGMYGMDIS